MLSILLVMNWLFNKMKNKHKKQSCLHYASRNGRINVLEYLIKYKQVSPFLLSEVNRHKLFHNCYFLIAVLSIDMCFIAWVKSQSRSKARVSQTFAYLMLGFSIKGLSSILTMKRIQPFFKRKVPHVEFKAIYIMGYIVIFEI